MKTGMQRIHEERKRQIEKEGWSSNHDNEHIDGALAVASACYAKFAWLQSNGGDLSFEEMSEIAAHSWPWGREWWKPSKDPIRNLEKAGALAAAEIDRILRILRESTDEGKEK